MPQRGKPTPADYKLIFEDNRVGAIIFQELCARFVRAAVTTGGIDGILKTYQNDGKREVLDYIQLQMNEAVRPRPAQTTEVKVE